MASTRAAGVERAALFEVQRPFSPAQWSAVAGAIAVLIWSIPGLIVNPDFAVGDSASAERVLGVDMNGWHALSGFFVAIPALLLASRPYPAAEQSPDAGRDQARYRRELEHRWVERPRRGDLSRRT
jgi:hypothetical protein